METGIFIFVSMTPSNISGKDDQLPLINKQMPVTEIVQKDYRTADVFLKYDIEFCCGGKWPLEMVCESKQLDTAVILLEMEEACWLIQLPQGSRFEDWGTDFLMDFIQKFLLGLILDDYAILNWSKTLRDWKKFYLQVRDVF